MITAKVQLFRERVAALPRDEIIDLIRQQDPDLVKQINRIEWVFRNKLTHLGIKSRDMTNEELAMILDPPFMFDRELAKAGFDKKQQQEIHVAADKVLWAKQFLKIEPRVYQILMLRDPNLRAIYRLGRRLGKTYTLAVHALHYAYTTPNGRVLVMAPMKSHVGLIYEECNKMVKDTVVGETITRNITSPQYEIFLSNGSSLRFFTTGMKSNSKGDVARGQEAHVIILDEMDYMAPDDLTALLPMLQKTDKNQPEKMLIASSTPTGRRERFYEWAHSPRYKEFYFPSFANPEWDKALEDELTSDLSPMGYRHEIEADWGDISEGVYARRFLDKAFIEEPNWRYVPKRQSANSAYFMGVDWDKYGAGPNIVVLEACLGDYQGTPLHNKLRVAYREELPRHEFVYAEAVQRIIKLNDAFDPEWIYLDAGAGDCVAPDTWITTECGGKEIIDINVGDKVLSADGTYREVLNKVVKDYPKPTYRVKIAKNLPVEVSDTHPFYAMTEDGKIGWKNITELKVGDKVAIQKPKNTEVIGDRTFYKIDKTGNRKYFRNFGDLACAGFNLWNIEKLKYEIGSQGLIDWFNPWEMEIRSKNKIRRGELKTIGMDLKNEQYLKPRLVIDALSQVPIDRFDDESVWSFNNNGNEAKINRFYDVFSEAFLTFAGWYISEGSASGGCVEISQSIENEEDVKEIVSCLRTVFGVEPSVTVQVDPRKDYFKTKGRFCIYSKAAVQLISHLFGKGSVNKRIPQFMMRYPHLLGPLVSATIRGDGSFVKATEYSYEIGLSSRTAIDQLRLTLVSQNILPSVYYYHGQKDNHNDQWKLLVSGNPTYSEAFANFTGLPINNRDRISRSCTTFVEDKIFVPIRKIDYIGEVEGLVDIEVEGAKSFVGNGILLHNSQYEQIRLFGMNHPHTKLHMKTKRIPFGSLLEMRDPYTRQLVKKAAKPYMVENLQSLLEREEIFFPASDEKLFLELLAYIVVRVNESGRPIFDSSGKQKDHAHDALILACLAFTENYGELHNIKYATKISSISNEAFLPLFKLEGNKPNEREEDIIKNVWGSENSAPIVKRRRKLRNTGRKTVSRKIF